MIFKEFGNKGHFDDTFESDENSESESEIDINEGMAVILTDLTS